MNGHFRRLLVTWMAILTLGNVGALVYAKVSNDGNDALFGRAICTTTARSIQNVERLTREGVLSADQSRRQIQNSLEFADEFKSAGYCAREDAAVISAARVKYVGRN